MVRPGGEFSLLQASSPSGQELARKRESASPSLGPVLAALCVHPTHLILKCCPNPLRLLGAFWRDRALLPWLNSHVAAPGLC